MTRWNHVHSLATGLVFGLVLDKEALVIFALGIALGVAGVFATRYARRAVGFVREQSSRITAARAEAHAAKTALDLAEAERKRAAAAELHARAEHRVRTAGEQRRENDRRYFDGARDAGSGITVRAWDWQDADEPPETILGVPVPRREEA